MLRRLQFGLPDHGGGICPRCGKAPESDLHRYWQCEHNLAQNDDCIMDTQNLVKHAEKGAALLGIYWLRGVPLSTMFNLSPPADEHEVCQLGMLDLSNVGEEHRRVHSDGSGGAVAGQATGMHQISDEDKACFDIIMGRVRRIQRRLSASLYIVQELDAEQIADRKAAIAHCPLAQRPKATNKSSLPSERIVPRKTKLIDEEFIKRFTLLGHRHRIVENANVFVIRCSDCTMQFYRQDLAHVLAKEPCTAIVPFLGGSGTLEFASGSNGVSSISSVLAAAESTNQTLFLPESQSERPKLELKASADDEPVPTLGAARKRSLPGGSALPLLSVPPLLAERLFLGRKCLHVSHRLEHSRDSNLCTKCGYFSVTRARELTRLCTGHPTINSRKHLNRCAQGLTAKQLLAGRKL